MTEEWVGLADAVTALKQELVRAMSQGNRDTLQFLLGSVEVEFLLNVKKAGAGDAAVKFGIVQVGARGGVDHSASHRVKLVLTPMDYSGRNPLISDEE